MKAAAVLVTLLLAACSSPERDAADQGPEPHDASAFGRDPAETHVISPDESDLHPPQDRLEAPPSQPR